MNHVLPTSTTTDERDRHAQVAILPIGSFEQHGPYLPLITDTVIATSICHELAVAYQLFELPPGYGVVLARAQRLARNRQHLPSHALFGCD